MKRRKVETFTVEGGCRFPVDMLRYDGCYPESQQDAAKIEHAVDAMLVKDRLALGGITLRTAHDSAPTTARWQSFSWRVTHINGERVA